MTRWDAVELDALLTTLRRADPEAATLCDGWQARHLVAHLYLRRHEPWQALRQGPGSRFAELADRAASADEYGQLVERFAAEPARVSPMGLMDGPLGMAVNFLEYAIHHEDVRRGAGPVSPRELPAEELDAIYDASTRMARISMRRAPTGVVLAVPGGRRTVVRRAPDAVAVIGSPLELMLVVSGRREAADVEVRGADATVAAFEAAQTD